MGFVVGSIVPGTRNTEDGTAAVAVGATGDGVVALNLISVLIQGAEQREDAVAGIKFEGDGGAENVAAVPCVELVKLPLRLLAI
jgi:hypothetical protein